MRYFFFGTTNTIEHYLEYGMNSAEDLNYYLTMGFAIQSFEPGDKPDALMGHAIEFGGYIEINQKEFDDLYSLLDE